MKWLNTAIIIGLVVISFLAGKQCSSADNEIITKETVTHTRDTIWAKDTTYVPKPYPVHDTEYVLVPYDIQFDSLKMKAAYQLRYYKKSYQDDNVFITIEDTILGYLMGRNVSYKLFVPLKIVDSVKIEKVSLKAPKWEIRGGFDITPRDLYLTGEYAKDRHNFSVGIDPFNKTGKLGYKYTLFRK
jgi:hypothetical protein